MVFAIDWLSKLNCHALLVFAIPDYFYYITLYINHFYTIHFFNVQNKNEAFLEYQQNVV